MTQTEVMKTEQVSSDITLLMTKELIITVKKELKRLANTPANLDIFDQAASINLLQQTCTHIDEITQNDTKIARELMLALLDLSYTLPQALTERYVDVCELLAESVHKLAQLYKASAAQIDHIIDLIIDRTHTDRWGIYYAMVAHFKDVLHDNGLERLQQKVMQRAPHMPRTAKKILIQIADIRNDVDAFIRACALDGKITTQQALAMAERLIEHKRFEDAHKCLSPFDTPDTDLNARCAAQELKAKILELEGKEQAAYDLLLEIFKTSLDSRIYKKLLEHPATDTNTFAQEALGLAHKHANLHVALGFFIDNQATEDIVTLVGAKESNLNGKNASLLGTAAQQIQTTHPEVATILYQIIIDADMAQARSDADTCLTAARALTSLVFLFHSTENQEIKNSINAYYATLNKKYAHKKAFWKMHDLLFNKTMAAIKKEEQENNSTQETQE